MARPGGSLCLPERSRSPTHLSLSDGRGVDFVPYLFYIGRKDPHGRPIMDAPPFALPATERQIAYARSLALRNQSLLPWEVQQDRRSLSAWIEAQAKLKPADTSHPTSKQVAFAERLARIKRRAVPDECFRDRQLLSRWIDSNR